MQAYIAKAVATLEAIIGKAQFLSDIELGILLGFLFGFFVGGCFLFIALYVASSLKMRKERNRSKYYPIKRKRYDNQPLQNSFMVDLPKKEPTWDDLPKKKPTVEDKTDITEVATKHRNHASGG